MVKFLCVTKKRVMRKIAMSTGIFMLIAAVSCSKKTVPTTADTPTTETTAAKPAKKPTIKTGVPKIITVNDKVAKKSIDGRYYYDLEGHRYWRNNRDGKYYLFHKSMFDNPDFKAL
jgi:hypothetical protein